MILMPNANFKGVHNISLNESACTPRVCEVILYLLSTLIDLGLLLTENTKEKQNLTEKTKIDDPDILSNHNMCMDIVVRCCEIFSIIGNEDNSAEFFDLLDAHKVVEKQLFGPVENSLGLNAYLFSQDFSGLTKRDSRHLFETWLITEQYHSYFLSSILILVSAHLSPTPFLLVLRQQTVNYQSHIKDNSHSSHFQKTSRSHHANWGKI